VGVVVAVSVSVAIAFAIVDFIVFDGQDPTLDDVIDGKINGRVRTQHQRRR